MKFLPERSLSSLSLALRKLTMDSSLPVQQGNPDLEQRALQKWARMLDGVNVERLTLLSVRGWPFQRSMAKWPLPQREQWVECLLHSSLKLGAAGANQQECPALSEDRVLHFLFYVGRKLREFLARPG